MSTPTEGMKPLYNVAAAAQLLSISPWTVRLYINRGKLHPVRIGRRVLLEEGELERFIADGKGRTEKEGEKTCQTM